MELFITIWNFINTHWSGIVEAITSTKLTADTIGSIKKVMPDLETKKLTQEYIEASVTMLNDQGIKVEDKEWELNTRRELVKNMVRLTEIDAIYNLIRGGLIMTFTTVALYFLVQWAQWVSGLRKK
jgi:hypothetical protein